MTDSNRALVEARAGLLDMIAHIPECDGDNSGWDIQMSKGEWRLIAAALVPAQEGARLAAVIASIKARALEARNLAADLNGQSAAAKEIDPGIMRSAYVMGAKHDWLMEAVGEVEGALSPPSQGVEKPRTWEDGWNAGFSHVCEQRPHTKADVSALVNALRQIKAEDHDELGQTGPAAVIAHGALVAFQSRQEGK